MLEHLAAVISPWIDLLEGRLPPLPCILSLTDSTTAAGWLRKSNFQESEKESPEMTKAKLEISRGHASRLMNNKCIDYSQWFPGKDNNVADALSRDNHLSDDELTSLLFSQIPEQVPPTFKISPLPQKIESFILSILVSLPESTQTPEELTHSKISLGHAGSSSSNQLNLEKTHSSPTSQTEKEQLSPPSLQKQSGSKNFLESLAIPWCLRQSAQPWTTYLRPSESLTMATRDSTNQVRLQDFYSNSLKATKKKIQMRNKRKQSPSASSDRCTKEQKTN